MQQGDIQKSQNEEVNQERLCNVKGDQADKVNIERSKTTERVQGDNKITLRLAHTNPCDPLMRIPWGSLYTRRRVLGSLEKVIARLLLVSSLSGDKST